MPAKPIMIHKLTPAQIALVDRLAASENGVTMDELEYRDVVAYQELSKLGMADMQVGQRRKVTIVLTESGARVRASGYFSKKPVLRLTEPQVKALRFIASGPRHNDEIPPTMLDVCRRMGLRGWVAYESDHSGQYWARITHDGWQILKLVDA